MTILWEEKVKPISQENIQNFVILFNKATLQLKIVDEGNVHNS